jgi:hypothetical protein
VTAKVVSKIELGRPATSVHGYVLAVFRARARAHTRTRSLKFSIVAFRDAQFTTGLEFRTERTVRWSYGRGNQWMDLIVAAETATPRG